MPSAAFRPVNPASNALHELAVVAAGYKNSGVEFRHLRDVRWALTTALEDLETVALCSRSCDRPN